MNSAVAKHDVTKLHPGSFESVALGFGIELISNLMLTFFSSSSLLNSVVVAVSLCAGRGANLRSPGVTGCVRVGKLFFYSSLAVFIDL